jgi:hypothetical protein
VGSTVGVGLGVTTGLFFCATWTRAAVWTPALRVPETVIRAPTVIAPTVARLPFTSTFTVLGTVTVTVLRRTSLVPPVASSVTVPAVASTAVTLPLAANFARTGFLALPGLPGAALVRG